MIVLVICFPVKKETVEARKEPATVPIPIIIVDYEKMSVPEMIDILAPKYGAKPKDIKKVAFCESSYNKEAIGDHGAAFSIMQFHKPTFEEYSKKFGEKLNYKSPYDQIKLASYMFSIGKQSHWSCSEIVGLI